MLLKGSRSGVRPTSLFSVPAVLALALGFTLGCASPGAPKPPSLHLPRPVQDLVAARSGDDVQIRFTVPSQTTDGLPLGKMGLFGTLCQQVVPGGVCRPVKPDVPLRPAAPGSRVDTVHWTDPLSRELLAAPVRAIAYKVQVRSDVGKSAGYSAPAFVAAGPAPPPLGALAAQGIRSGVLLRWTPVPDAGEVLLKREQLDPAPEMAASSRTKSISASKTSLGSRKPVGKDPEGTVWLQAEPGNKGPAQTIDGTLTEDVLYRYTALRRTTVQVGGHTLELRSAPSVPVEITWRDIYPPPAPQGLTALGFAETLPGASSEGPYAVDLIWQPVDDLRVTGYLVSRVALSPAGEPQGAAERLTKEPVTTPAFHDATALRTTAYRYTVTAVDAKGNASSPAETYVKAATTSGR